MKKIWLIAALISLALAGCAGEQEVFPGEEDAVPVSNETPYETTLLHKDGKEVGTASLTETKEGVKIHVQVEALEPGTKAIHIHETGICEAPTFESAGSHFNPKGKEHGFQNPKGFHAGDLPNIEIDKDGKVNVMITAPNVTLEVGKENSLFDEDGSALVIHEKADDYKTDPAGNAGERIVCGVIKK